MILFDAPHGQRLRPVHLLLMLYRYLSGVYQLGDLSALNYVKGFLDGGRRSAPRHVLTVSGHGIGEPELWLSDRLPGATIDTMSFRLVDTQLLQFLRSAGPAGVARVFDQFKQLAESLEGLAELVADDGLVPYWELEASEWSAANRTHVRVYSDTPLNIPDRCRYDLIYVSHGLRYLSSDVIRRLQAHTTPGGWLAVLVPAGGPEGRERFAESEFVRGAKVRFNDLLARRGYAAVRDGVVHADLTPLASEVECIRFAVPAPASTVLSGELLLYSMHEHVSDRARLEVLAEALRTVRASDVPVKEVLHLIMIEGAR